MIADSASGVSKHLFGTEGLGQPLGDPEDAAEGGDVFAEHEHMVVGDHRIVQGPVDRRHHGQFGGHPGSPSAVPATSAG